MNTKSLTKNHFLIAFFVICNIVMIIILLTKVNFEPKQNVEIQFQDFISQNFDLTQLAPNGTPVFVIFIGYRYCLSCVDEEIILLNQLSERLPNIPIKLIVAEDIENFRKKFPLNVIPEHISKYLKSPVNLSILSNPKTIIVDHNFVLDVREVDTNKPFNSLLSKAYYEKLYYFFTNY